MAKLKLILAAALSVGALSTGALILNQSGENVALAQTASAKSTVNAAIKAGTVGEKLDGYLGIVSGTSPSADVRAAVAEINIARKSVYTKLAKRQGVDTHVVAGLTGEKQIKKSASGDMVFGASGRWDRK